MPPLFCLTMCTPWCSLSLTLTGGVQDLAEIIHSVKRFSVHEINKRQCAKGTLWQDERYDRMVRDEAEFSEKWDYIRNNPVKAGLAERPEKYAWLYERG